MSRERHIVTDIDKGTPRRSSYSNMARHEEENSGNGRKAARSHHNQKTFLSGLHQLMNCCPKRPTHSSSGKPCHNKEPAFPPHGLPHPCSPPRNCPIYVPSPAGCRQHVGQPNAPYASRATCRASASGHAWKRITSKSPWPRSPPRNATCSHDAIVVTVIRTQAVERRMLVPHGRQKVAPRGLYGACRPGLPHYSSSTPPGIPGLRLGRHQPSNYTPRPHCPPVSPTHTKPRPLSGTKTYASDDDIHKRNGATLRFILRPSTAKNPKPPGKPHLARPRPALPKAIKPTQANTNAPMREKFRGRAPKPGASRKILHL